MTAVSAQPRPVAFSWYLILFCSIPLGFIFHEAAHWAMGTAFGEDMAMSLSKAWPVDGNFDSELIYQLVSAAGPVFTTSVALLGAWLALVKGQVWGYALVYSSFMIRFSAFAVSAFNLNDEARISVYLGWPWYVLPAIVSLALLALTVFVSRRLKIGWKTNLLGYVVISIGLTVTIGLDGQLPGQ